jgi:hypothetical protein
MEEEEEGPNRVSASVVHYSIALLTCFEAGQTQAASDLYRYGTGRAVRKALPPRIKGAPTVCV